MKAAFVNPLLRGNRPGYPAAIERIKSRTRSLLSLNDDTTVAVTELACRDPGCPDMETIVAVLAAGAPTRTARFHKPILEITDEDLVEGLRALR